MKPTLCLHCAAVIGIDNKQVMNFCCFGCKTAYMIIKSLKLDQYYDFCQSIYQISPDKVRILQNNINYIDFIQTNQNMENSIQLMVEGIKCGSCVWLIESSFRQQDGILQASVNMTTKTLSLTWIGDIKQIDVFIKLIENIGYRAIPLVEEAVIASQKKSTKKLLKMIALSGVVWVQNMMISMGIWAGDISGEIGINSRVFMNICAAVLTIPILTYTSRTFFSSALVAIKAWRSHMDIPISIAIIGTLLISVYGTIIGSTFVFYEAASSLVFALLIGRYLEAKAINQANEYARNLILKKSLFITVDRDAHLELVNINSVKIGEIIHVTSGERVPLDGIVLSGESEVDNSIITGESNPQKITIGSEIFAGSINLENPIKIKVTSSEENTVLAEIKRLIEKTSNQKSKYKTFASKVAAIYTPAVLVLSLLTILISLHSTDLSEAILHGVSVLVITCPCAMGLAVPIVYIVATSNLMKKGIFIKTQDTLERLSEINSVALDKTGVLTYGKSKLTNISDIPNNIQQLIKSLAVNSKHHLCRTIVDDLKDINNFELSNVTEDKGYGISGTYKDKTLLLGRQSWCGISNVACTNDINILSAWLVIKKDDVIELSIELKFKDQLKEEAYDFIKTLKQQFSKICIISGDIQQNVEHIAKTLEVDEFYSALSPKDKYNIINSKQQNNELILMIGDGLNDAACMSLAHCSASPSNVIELSQNQSSIVFQRNLFDIIDAINIAKKSTRVCKENIAISLIYNIISIPLAMFGYASPLIAAIFMGLSSIFVILNTLLRMR